MILHCCLDLVPSTHPKTSLRQCLERDMFILPSASLVSKDAIKAVGMFDERLSGYEDDDLFTRLFSATYDSVYVNRPVTKWRIYSSSTSFSHRMAKSRMTYFKKQLELYPDDPGIDLNWSREVIGPRFMQLVYNDFVQTTRLRDVPKMDRAWTDVETVASVMKEGTRRRVRFLSPIVRFLYKNGLRRRARLLSRRARL